MRGKDNYSPSTPPVLWSPRCIAKLKAILSAAELVILVGHANHPEVIGTMGQLPEGAVVLVETIGDVQRLATDARRPLAYVTQTTLSVDDTRNVVAALTEKFPGIAGPHRDDICYATTNRQDAVRRIAPQVDALIVVGSPNSSNSQRLKEVAERAGCPLVRLLLRADDIDWSLYGAIGSLGLTAGASAPEILVEEIIAAFAEHYTPDLRFASSAAESVFFPLPRLLRESGSAL